MAAAAPPQRSSDWEMKGTSRIGRGEGAGWASSGPASATITMSARALSVHRNDDQDKHQQCNDDHRRRDDHFRLAAGEGVLDLPRLRRDTHEIVALQGRDGARRATEIDACPFRDAFDFGVTQHT